MEGREGTRREDGEEKEEEEDEEKEEGGLLWPSNVGIQCGHFVWQFSVGISCRHLLSVGIQCRHLKTTIKVLDFLSLYASSPPTGQNPRKLKVLDVLSLDGGPSLPPAGRVPQQSLHVFFCCSS